MKKYLLIIFMLNFYFIWGQETSSSLNKFEGSENIEDLYPHPLIIKVPKYPLSVKDSIAIMNILAEQVSADFSNYLMNGETQAKEDTTPPPITSEKQRLALIELEKADNFFRQAKYKDALDLYNMYLDELFTTHLVHLARIYWKGGEGIEPDKNLALHYFELALNSGSTAAHFYLGIMELNAGNKDDAVWYFEGATEKGIYQANTYLGWIYETEKTIDLNKALSYYAKAATKGDVFGQYQLARLYEEGKGVKSNINEARYWYGEAAKKGYSKAITKLSSLK